MWWRGTSLNDVVLCMMATNASFGQRGAPAWLFTTWTTLCVCDCDLLGIDAWTWGTSVMHDNQAAACMYQRGYGF
jgi:hypothetical protein